MSAALAFDSTNGIHGEGIAEQASANREVFDDQPRDERGRWEGGGGDSGGGGPSEHTGGSGSTTSGDDSGGASIRTSPASAPFSS
jgi:hypothetical protein